MILIVGHSGFLGDALYRDLKRNGHKVVGASKRKTHPDDFAIDIRDPQSFQQITEVPEVVINCAAVLPGGDSNDAIYVKSCFDVNAVGVLNVANFCKQKGVKKMIHFSTLAVNQKPWPLGMTEKEIVPVIGAHSAYAMSKLSGEILLQASGFQQFKIVRISALYGPGMPWKGVLCQFIDAARKVGSIKLTNGTKICADFIFIDDVVAATKKLTTNQGVGIFNLASGEETSLLKLAEAVQSVYPCSIENTDDSLTAKSPAKISIKAIQEIVGDFRFTLLTEGIRRLSAVAHE